jgi:alginate O-acetyltransferase complex protein AlgI
VNLAITMLLGGLWHGASWNFVIWGGMHGAALAVDKARMSIFRSVKETRFLRVIGVIVTFHLVCFCWIFFRASSLHDSMVIIRQIGTNFDAGAATILFAGYNTVFMMMLLGFALHFVPQVICDKIVIRMEKLNIAGFIAIFLAFMFIFYQIKCSEQVMPIYLQF